MITYKVFVQIYLALTLNQDINVSQHLCSALRENVNFQSRMKECTQAREEDCLATYEKKCEAK